MFTHLHVHSEYSLLDGLCKIPELLNQADKLNQKAIALTDHGVLYGAIQFYKEAVQRNIKPIIGIEAYLSSNSRHSKEVKDKQNFHMTLLAKNNVGYQNLVSLSSKSHLEGYYYKPRIDHELLEKYHEGIIALSGCNSSKISRLLEQEQFDEAIKLANYYKNLFGDFYIEIQEHNIPGTDKLNKQLIQLSKDTKVPLVATNDVHYVNKAQAYVQDILLCIGTNSVVTDENRMRMAGDSDSYYLKSQEEMSKLLPGLDDALENSWRIAEMCDISLEFSGYKVPQAEIPPDLNPHSYLTQLCKEGLNRLYKNDDEKALKRLTYELSVLEKTGFSDYILVVFDIARHARQENILMTVRGSAAASIILYCLGVTEIDPLEHNLVFERFIHDQRREMPDVDLDFEESRRDEVMRYAAEKYGHDRVAQIITFGTLGAKASIRDVGRALGMSYNSVDKVAKMVPTMAPSFGTVTIDKALKESPELADLLSKEPEVANLIDVARSLEGVARHASTHAAGVVIAPEPLENIIPLQRPTSGNEMALPTTQYSMNDVANLGLLKMDFLGLTNLAILSKAIDLIKATRKTNVDIDNIPDGDEKTYEMLSSGDTFGVFQMESAGMRRYVQQLKPSSLGDLAAMVALYRPGPMQHIPTYINAKHGKEKINHPHPDLADLLNETYGVIVYQDQVLLIAQKFAGYTLGQADVMRKAMGKKIPKVMSDERNRFLSGAVELGYPKELATEVFNLIEPFAGYAFNKAHAVSYGSISYQTAYLKANYPEEYMAAILSAADQSRIAEAYPECVRLGIPVLAPDINKSSANFSLDHTGDTTSIRFGISSVKNVGINVAKGIIEERVENGLFGSSHDFFSRVPAPSLNKRSLECLIKTGAFDGIDELPNDDHHPTRDDLLFNLDRFLSIAQNSHQARETGQGSLFDILREDERPDIMTIQKAKDETPQSTKLAEEKDLLGIYISEHPFKEASADLAHIITPINEIDISCAGQNLMIAGLVINSRSLTTKDGRSFMIAELEDLSGSIEVAIWQETLDKTRQLWEEGNIIYCGVRLQERNDRLNCSLIQAHKYEKGTPINASITKSIKEKRPSQKRPFINRNSPNQSPTSHSTETERTSLRITLLETQNSNDDQNRLRSVVRLLSDHDGNDSVYLTIKEQNGEETELKLPESKTSNQLKEEISIIIGQWGTVELT